MLFIVFEIVFVFFSQGSTMCWHCALQKSNDGGASVRHSIQTAMRCGKSKDYINGLLKMGCPTGRGCHLCRVRNGGKALGKGKSSNKQNGTSQTHSNPLRVLSPQVLMQRYQLRDVWLCFSFRPFYLFSCYPFYLFFSRCFGAFTFCAYSSESVAWTEYQKKEKRRRFLIPTS